MNCEYVRNYYNVPARLGRKILYKGKSGIIAEDRGNYIGVNFDDDKPSRIVNIHPLDKNLEYKGMGKIRKLTKSQQRYQDYLHSDFGLTFAEWLGIKSNIGR